MNAQKQTTRLEFSADPAVVKAGQLATWQLRFRDEEKDQAVTDFEITHDKRLHLIVVSRDLAWFEHVHPEYQGNGTFTVQVSLPRAGNYKLFADFTRSGVQEVLSYEFSVAQGDVSASGAFPGGSDIYGEGWRTQRVIAHPADHAQHQANSHEGQVYEVAFTTDSEELRAGQSAALHFQVRDAQGRPIRDLQTYLGALGHVVIISEDTNTFLHAHPKEHVEQEHGHGEAPSHHSHHSARAHAAAHGRGPDVIFYTAFPTAGGYRAWGEFQHANQTLVASFRLNVQEE